MARCTHCGVVFSLPDKNRDEDRSDSRKPLRPRVAMPNAIAVERMGSILEIRRNWFSAAAFFLLFFTIFWNGFMIVWHTIALSMGAWFMSCFGLIHTGVGLFMIYYTTACFMNTTTIRVGNGSLDVSSGPLPWFGAVSLQSSAIKQLYCREKINRGKNGAHVTYEVVAITNGQRKDLVSGLTDAEQALYIEQEVENHLGIEDTAVRGELRQ